MMSFYRPSPSSFFRHSFPARPIRRPHPRRPPPPRRRPACTRTPIPPGYRSPPMTPDGASAPPALVALVAAVPCVIQHTCPCASNTRDGCSCVESAVWTDTRARMRAANGVFCLLPLPSLPPTRATTRYTCRRIDIIITLYGCLCMPLLIKVRVASRLVHFCILKDEKGREKTGICLTVVPSCTWEMHQKMLKLISISFYHLYIVFIYI